MSMDPNGRVLTPGFDAQSFNYALNEMVKIVGEENVSFDGKSGSLQGVQGQRVYGDTWPLAEHDEHAPSGAIRPSSVAEVEQVLRTANKLNLPLWKMPMGKNLGYGGSAPVVRGTVVLDLHRMNRIIEVNEEYAYAIVEPGVSFIDLYDHIVNNDYEVWPSVPAIGWGSVLGNNTERGFGYTRNHSSDEELTAIQKQRGWGFWTAYFAIYAQSAALAEANWTLVQLTFADLPGSKCQCQKFAADEGRKLSAKDLPEGPIPHNGVPRLTPLGMVNVWGNGGGHVDFSPLFPPGGKELSVWYRKMKEMVKQANFDLFADFHVMERYTIGIICIVYGPNEGPRAKTLFSKPLNDAVVEDSATEYRTHNDFMDDVAKTFTFENSALRRFLTGLKDHLDPNGILSQGRSGIWSKWKPPSTLEL